MAGGARSAPAQATPPLCLVFTLLVALGLARPAQAQISGTVGVQSDYRYRGIPLSSGRPAATFDLAYDHPSGLYAGVSTIVDGEQGHANFLGDIEYLGYVTPTRGGLSLDVGLDNQDLSYVGDKRYPLTYSEVYAGVIGAHLSAHLHYSPDYVRAGYGSLYADADGSMQPAEHWRLFAHVGSTIPVGYLEGRRPRYDARVGVARQFGPFELQASLTTTTPDPPPRTPQGRTAVVVGASWFF